MATIGRLNALLSADTAAFTTNIDRARRNLSSNATRMNRSLAKVDRGFKSAGKSAALFAKSQLGLRSIIGVIAGSAGIGLLVKRSIDAADSIAKLADATGLGTTAVQEYRFALDLAGVAQEQTDKSLLKFTRNMGELARSSSETQTALKDLDPALLKNLRSLNSVEDQLELGFRALASYTSQSKRAAVAAALFGRSGVLMTVAVKDGAAAFEAARRRASELDLILGDKLLQSTVKTKDQFTEFTKQIDINTTRIGLSLAPAILGLTGLFADLTTGISAAGKALGSAFAPSAQAQLASLEAQLVSLKAKETAPFFPIFPSAAEGRVGPRRGTTTGAAPGPGTPQRRPGTVGVDPIKVLELRIAALKKIVALENEAAAIPPSPTLGPDIQNTEAFDLLNIKALKIQDELAARQIDTFDGLTAAILRTREEDERRAEVARQNLDIVFSGISTAKERFMLELDFLDKARQGLIETNQLTAERETLLDRGTAAAKKRFLASSGALAIIDQTRTATERHAIEVDKLNGLLREGAIDQDTYSRAVAQANQRLLEANGTLRLLESGFDLLDDVLAGNMDTWQDWARVALRALEQVLGGILQTGSTGGGILGGLFGGSGSSSSSGGGGVFGGVFSTGGSGGFGGGIGGLGGIFDFFEHGGRPPLNRLSIVGESGPELFKPDVAGTIIPNSGLGEGGGGKGGDTYYVDNRGASLEAVVRLERFVLQRDAIFEKRAISAVVDHHRRTLEFRG